MADSRYEAVLNEIDKLTPPEQLRLLSDLAGRLSLSLRRGKQHSILELRGLGKEVWSGIDPDRYVEQERS